MRALRDFNLPKIVADDRGVFMGLIQDLFPQARLLRDRVRVRLRIRVRSASASYRTSSRRRAATEPEP